MSVNADLRASFELHRSRVLRLKHNCLAKLFEILEILPDTTEPEELDIVRSEEWPANVAGRLPNPIRSSADLYALINDGTKAPLTEEERLQMFTEIEAILEERATGSDPRTLPDDFKQLCALTNSLEGLAFPVTNSQIPSAFKGLNTTLAGLKYPFLSPEQLRDSTGLEALDYETSVILDMGDVSGGVGGGSWLCWCRNDSTEPWRWLWATRVGHEQPPTVYEDVKDLLDRYCETYLDVVISSYDDDIAEGVL